MNKRFSVLNLSLLFLFILTLNFSCKGLKTLDFHNVNKVVLMDNYNETFVLNSVEKNRFIKDINKVSKVDFTLFQVCYKFEIIDDSGKKCIIETDGYYLLIENNCYVSNENLITKYWNILEENFCREKSIKYIKSN